MCSARSHETSTSWRRPSATVPFETDAVDCSWREGGCSNDVGGCVCKIWWKRECVLSLIWHTSPPPIPHTKGETWGKRSAVLLASLEMSSLLDPAEGDWWDDCSYPLLYYLQPIHPPTLVSGFGRPSSQSAIKAAVNLLRRTQCDGLGFPIDPYHQIEYREDIPSRRAGLWECQIDFRPWKLKVSSSALPLAMRNSSCYICFSQIGIESVSWKLLHDRIE